MAIDVPEATMPYGEPVLRWRERAHSIDEIDSALARIWAAQDLTVTEDGEPARRIAARTSVMNLVVVARRPEYAERCAATMQALTGRHPSRTIVIQSADPDGPSWLDARVEAHCVLPRPDAPETCAETIHVTCGGEAGRHLSAIATPLVVHDLPVTIWWPGEPPFRERAAIDLLTAADRLIVDGSTWSGDGLARLRDMAELADSTTIAVSDFALIRQSRWREAIASIFDDPDFLPYLRSLRRIAVTYGTHDETGAPGSTNLVKPIYHVGWLASRLDLSVVKPLAEAGGRGRAPSPASARGARPGAAGTKPVIARGLAATLSDGRAEVGVVVRPVVSSMPPGTTLRVELLAERRGSELRADVTAEAETVHVRVWLDGVEALDRSFRAPRRTEVELLAEAIESGGRDPVAVGALRSAPRIVGAGNGGSGMDDDTADGTGHRNGRPSVTEPEIVVVADPAALATEAAERIVAALTARSWPAAAPTGRPPAARHRSGSIGSWSRRLSATRSTGPTCTSGGATTASFRTTTRSPTSRPFDDVMLDFSDMEEGTAGGPGRGVPIPVDQVHPFPTGEAIGNGGGTAWCAATLAGELRAADLPSVGRLAGRSTCCCSASARTGTSCRSSRDRRRSIPSSWRSGSRRRRTSSRTSSGSP